MPHRSRKLVIVALCVFWSAVLIFSQLAWFAGVWTSDSSKVEFTTSGSPQLLDMCVWMYESQFEVNGEEQPRWILNSSTKATDNSGFFIPSYVENDADTSDQFVLESLHFGKIDNLTSLNPDNKIYFCFKLNKATHGHANISFYFDYAFYNDVTDPTNNPNDPRHSIRIYDMDREPINHFEGNGLTYDVNNKDLMELLEFSYCVSSTAPPTTEEIPGDDPFGGNIIFSSPTAITNDLLNQNTGLLPGTEDYYLYVCISPKLENYAMHDHILEFFAQSYMLFDISFSFEVHD